MASCGCGRPPRTTILCILLVSGVCDRACVARARAGVQLPLHCTHCLSRRPLRGGAPADGAVAVQHAACHLQTWLSLDRRRAEYPWRPPSPRRNDGRSRAGLPARSNQAQARSTARAESAWRRGCRMSARLRGLHRLLRPEPTKATCSSARASIRLLRAARKGEQPAPVLVGPWSTLAVVLNLKRTQQPTS